MPYKDKNSPKAIEATRASRRKHYYANKAQYRANNDLKRKRLREWLMNLKSVPCMDCGISYPPFVMDLDHRDPSQKKYNVGGMTKMGSWNKMIEEASKCDVVCSNCHRIRTHGKAQDE